MVMYLCVPLKVRGARVVKMRNEGDNNQLTDDMGQTEILIFFHLMATLGH